LSQDAHPVFVIQQDIEGPIDVHCTGTVLGRGDSAATVSSNFGPTIFAFSSVGCMSEAGASFEFDQAAFDEQHGVDTFPLVDHYAIDLSPGLVPEPTSRASAFAALASLFSLASVRKRRGRVVRN
jgi:hypothetical protein